jgi:glycosyltransferase involved in cell wall biosynthesis
MGKTNEVFIVLDNLRVGGIQRLALDEAYSLVEEGKRVALIVLEDAVQIDDIREIDGNFFSQYSLNVLFVPGGKRKQIVWFIEFLRKERPSVVLCHSAKGIGLVRISSLMLRQKVFVAGFLHQLASMSNATQKVKRLMLFLMADQIRASSKQFILEFETVYRKLPFLNRLIAEKMYFDRMGVNLARIDWQQTRESLIPIAGRPALIFNSRITNWKGFDTFVELARKLGQEFQYILITSRNVHQVESVSNFTQMETAKVFYGKNVSHFLWKVPSIHIYPTKYGVKVKYQQNIGLNVLECLALGIPSIISSENFETWPELDNSNGVYLTDWNLPDVGELIRALVKNIEISEKLAGNSFREFIGIDSHIIRMLELFH